MTKINRFLGRTVLPFPFGRPNWPNSIERIIPKQLTGANFETDWSRTTAVRAVRSLITDYVTKPTIELVAKPKILGLDRISHVEAPLIFAANHASHVDTPLLLVSLPSEFRHKTVVGAGADYFFDKKYKGYIWSFLLGAIPIERIRVSRQSNDLARKVLGEGWNLILFPEGGRTPDGFAHDFKGGVAQLSSKTQRPVVPVYIGGTYEILGKQRGTLQRGTSVVNFGYPMAPSNEDPREFAKAIENQVARLADEVYSDFWTACKNQGTGQIPALKAPDNDSWIADWKRPRYSDLEEKTEKSWPRLPILNKMLK